MSNGGPEREAPTSLLNLNMKKIKAKRILKVSTPTDPILDADPLVKWAIDCISSDSPKEDLTPAQPEQDNLARELRAAHAQIHILQDEVHGILGMQGTMSDDGLEDD